MSDQPTIPLCEPSLGGRAEAYLRECLESGFVSSVGPFVGRFETEFARWVGAPRAVACASGTAALHVALRMLDVGPGDEVFVSTLTFIASANPILYERATPVFVDAERATWNLDPALVVEELDRRARRGLKQPKAVEVVHVLGQPADIEPIAAACLRHGVALLEDAAESLGASYTQGEYAGRQVGTIGRLGCFSFNGNKVITTGGGGMLVCADEAAARRAKHLTTQAKLPGDEYWHNELGYNYRLTNLAAALGVAQLEQLPEFLRRKRSIAARYDAGLAGLPGITAPPRVPWADSSCWLYAIRVDPAICGFDRRRLATALAEAGIQTRAIWAPLHKQSPFAAAPRLGGAVAERLFAEGLTLPSSAHLSDAQQRRVMQTVRQFHALYSAAGRDVRGSAA